MIELRGDTGAGVLSITFRDNETRRLSVRAGQHLLWLRTDFFSGGREISDWQILDFWELKDGDFITVTNRLCDLPAWFRLHPLEIAGIQTLREYEPRLNAKDYPDEPIDGPNIWRVLAGDRLVWVSMTDSGSPVQEILDLRCCAAVVGDNCSGELDEIALFGAPAGENLSPETQSAWRAGIGAAVEMGAPRVLSAEWRFGG